MKKGKEKEGGWLPKIKFLMALAIVCIVFTLRFALWPKIGKQIYFVAPDIVLILSLWAVVKLFSLLRLKTQTLQRFSVLFTAVAGPAYLSAFVIPHLYRVLEV